MVAPCRRRLVRDVGHVHPAHRPGPRLLPGRRHRAGGGLRPRVRRRRRGDRLSTRSADVTSRPGVAALADGHAACDGGAAHGRRDVRCRGGAGGVRQPGVSGGASRRRGGGDRRACRQDSRRPPRSQQAGGAPRDGNRRDARRAAGHRRHPGARLPPAIIEGVHEVLHRARRVSGALRARQTLRRLPRVGATGGQQE